VTAVCQGAVHLGERGGPGLVLDEVLRDVPHHHDEIGAAGGDVRRGAVDPGGEVAVLTGAGDVEHGGGGVHADRLEPAPGEVDREHAGPAAEVDDGPRPDLGGQRQIEVVIMTSGALGVVGGDGARVLGPQ
jgi:hypothetical protein